MFIKEMLTYYREEKGWTISDLSRKSGLGTSHICQIENGKRLPTIPTLSKLVEALEITKEHLEIENLIGINLVKIRMNTSYTQKDVEILSGLSKGHLSRIERGHRRRPDIETLRKIMEVYKLPMSRLTEIPNDFKTPINTLERVG